MQQPSGRHRRELTAEIRYEILRDISFRIRDTFDLDEILNRLLDTVKTIIDYDAAGIFVLSQDVVHTPYHAPKRVISGIVQRGFDERPADSDEMLTHGKGIVGHVIQTGECVVAPDVRNDPTYIAGRERTRSEIAVPIFRNHASIGALNLESDKPGAYKDNDLDVLRFLSDAASISIEKALQHVQLLDKKRMEDQLEIAREVQERLLPVEAPRMRDYAIAGVCLPTYEIGGDYYDFLKLDADSLGIVVADVSGNGVPAALLMMAFRALLLTNVPLRKKPSEMLEVIDGFMPEFARKKDFITVVYGVLDVRDHVFQYSNAGHCLPFVLRASGMIDSLELVGPGLNIKVGGQYQMNSVCLEPNDLLVLYTDGVVDVFDSQGEDFGLERLKKVITEASHLPVQEIIGRVLAATQEFSGSAIHGDDLTIVIAKRLPPRVKAGS